MNLNVLKATDLTAKHNQVELEISNLTLSAGDIMAVVGLNGSGKSLLLAALAGALPVKKGKVEICGFAADSYEAKRLFGYVPKGCSLYNELTLSQYLSMFCDVYDLERHYRPYMIRETLDLVGMLNYIDTPIENLTDSFLRQKLAIARSLVHNPRLLIVDDCFNGVEPSNVKGMADIFAAVRGTGKAMILSSDCLLGLEKIANKICILAEGKPLVLGKISQLRAVLHDTGLIQMQLLDPFSADKCINVLKEEKGVFNLQQSKNDNGLLRFIFQGSKNELDSKLTNLRSGGVKIVSCSVIQSFTTDAF